MTEAEWLICADPKPMLDFLKGSASDRKLRLFACARCRGIWHLMTDQRSRNVVEIAEAFCEGIADENQLEHVRTDAHNAFAAPRSAPSEILWAAAFAADEPAFFIAGRVAALIDAVEAERGTKVSCSAVLVRDIFGNPFRPVAIDPKWQMPAIVRLGKDIYDDRVFERMPELADALKKAGCIDKDVLEHCRGPGPHVRGCWVLDLILGKE